MFPRFFLSLVLFIFPMLVQAQMRGHSCMGRHMREAINLNRARGPLYSKLSQGESEQVTKRLISMEQGLLLGSIIIDTWARPFQWNGIPVVCYDLIEMSQTPSFKEKNPKGKVPRKYLPPGRCGVDKRKS